MLKRQGDILFALTIHKTHAPGARKIEDGVIALGETTGHAHKLEGDATLYSIAGGMTIAVGEAGADVVHEEHDKIELEPGIWIVHRQREYVGPNEEVTVYD